jgi:competence protein ComGC
MTQLIEGILFILILCGLILFFLFKLDAHNRNVARKRLKEKKKLLESMSAEERLQHEAERKSKQIANEGFVQEISMLPVYLVVLFIGGVIVWAVGKTVITWAFGVAFPS